MSLYSTSGDRVIPAKTRIRDEEAREERDRSVFEKRCEGFSREEVAAMFRITVRYVRIIEKRIPKKTRIAIARAAKEYMEIRKEMVSELVGGN